MKKYKITSAHYVTIDSWTDGELDYANGYSQEAEIEAKDPLEAIKKYFAEVLYYKYTQENAFIDEGELMYDVLVDVDNYEASKRMVEQWKKDEITLYSNSIIIKVQELTKIELK
jgi:hypothetical protein